MKPVSPEIEWRTISLSRGQIALIDSADYEWAQQFTWHASWSEETQSYYAKRNVTLPGGKHTTRLMHRELLGLQPGDRRRTDHQSHDTLDNRRLNLRIATASQNNMNRIGNRQSTSEFKGVCFDSDRQKWLAQIKLRGKNLFLGRFNSPDLAAAAYRRAAELHFGEFALNHQETGA